MTVRIDVRQGDCLDVLAEMKAAGVMVDSVVTDPPYHLTSIVKRFGGQNAAAAKDRDGLYKRASKGFMGKTWDGGDVAFRVETWRAVFDVLRPGGHMVAFSGTRTYHRMACAIEDAGFEVRDTVAWLYGSGFPKSHDVAKALDKSIAGVHRGRAGRAGVSFGQEYERTDKGNPISDAARAWDGWGTALKPAFEPICLARKPLAERSIAANVLRHGTGAVNVDGCRVPYAGEADQAAAAAEQRSRQTDRNFDGWGMREQDITADAYMSGGAGLGRWPANVVHDGAGEVVELFPNDGLGSAARFFYSAKADAADRVGSKHPTVKPVDLMRWLVRLITPPGGTVLDPFAGTGTVGGACMAENFNAVLIEREAEYVADIRRRIDAAHGLDSELFKVVGGGE